jgi:hypothetical protein
LVDDFSDNNRDGWYLFNQGFDVDTRFLKASSGFMQTVSSDEILQWGAVANFSPVDLSANGYYIKLTLNFQVRYARAPFPEGANLYNQEGYPASLFSTAER